MVRDHSGKCDLCGQERRWAYSGNYRAYYCDVDKRTTLEQWDQTKNMWIRKVLHELQSSS
jgi:hypothetical protein